MPLLSKLISVWIVIMVLLAGEGVPAGFAPEKMGLHQLQ